MKRFRFRLRSLLWLVAIVAAIMWGIRYRQDREAMPKLIIFRGGKTIVHELSPDSDFLVNMKVLPRQAATGPRVPSPAAALPSPEAETDRHRALQ